jgi:hypothetical protein
MKNNLPSSQAKKLSLPKQNYNDAKPYKPNRIHTLDAFICGISNCSYGGVLCKLQKQIV